MKEKKRPDEGFDPNGVGLKNGNFIGLPFDEKSAKIVLLPVPWDVTVSYRDGTSRAPQNILNASSQLDLFDEDAPDAWQLGIFMKLSDPAILAENDALREKSKAYIDFLEAGGSLDTDKTLKSNLDAVNAGCQKLKNWVKEQTADLLQNGKLVGIVGGEHSVPLGYLEALSEVHKSFGILQIDAHLDLREAYEGFTFSHASIFFNVLKIKNIKRLSQVGIRDFCDAECTLASKDRRVSAHTEAAIRKLQFKGKAWGKICAKIVKTLPEKVYVSFDIDGLDPSLCPNTGTPVPGGLSYQEAIHLLREVVESGRKIIGFDLCEVGGAGHEWDGNVGARILYKLCNLMALSNGLKK